MDNKLKNNEITGSIEEVLNKRIFSSVYGTFSLSWAVFHWEFLYTAFFVAEDSIMLKTGLLKNEYLIENFFNPHYLYFYVSWIAPFIFTWFIIWKLPRWFLLPAFKEDEKYRIEKAKFRVEIEKTILIKETELVKKEEEKFVAEERKNRAEKKAEEVDPRIMWRKEYQDFKSSTQYTSFPKLIESIYEHSGRTVWSSENGFGNYGLENSFLAYVHSHGIIELIPVPGSSSQRANLTEKGKFFVSMYSQNN